MAGEQFVAKSVLEADTQPFIGNVERAEGAMAKLEGSTIRLQAGMRTLVQASRGFGLAAVFHLAAAAGESVNRVLEDMARKQTLALGGAFGGGLRPSENVQALLGRAADARAQAARGFDFGIPANLFKSVASDLAGSLIHAISLGFADTARDNAFKMADAFWDRFRQLEATPQAATEEAEQLERQARRQGAFEKSALDDFRRIGAEAARVGLADKWREILTAFQDGVSEAEIQQSRELGREIGRRTKALIALAEGR